MIWSYVENPRLSQKAVRINKFNKVIQNQHTKLTAFLHTNKEQYEKRKLQRQVYTNIKKNYLGAILTKEVKDLYKKNCKILLIEMKMTK